MTDNTDYKYLPLTLSMETLGGISTPLVKRGTPLPTKRRQRFSTAADDQTAITVSIFYGESPVSQKNISLGKFDLTGFPAAPRGETTIEVEFDVDQECHIKVTAAAMKSGKAISSTNSEFRPNLLRNKVEEMLRKAIDEQQEDQALAQQIDANNNAANLMHRAEKYLRGQQRSGLLNSIDNQIEEAIAHLGLALQDNNIGTIKDKSKRLQELLPNTDIDFSNLSGAFNNLFTAGNKLPRKSPAPRRDGGVNASARKPNQTEEIVKSKEGIFTAGQYFDAKRVVRDLFATATQNIVIIDTYIGEDVLNLLTVKRNGVSVKLLMGKVSPAFLTLATDFNRQYKNLEIRSSKMFHDRFVFVDDISFYHFGASLEHLGNKTFMFSKIEEPLIIAELKKQWSTGWGQALVSL